MMLLPYALKDMIMVQLKYVMVMMDKNKKKPMFFKESSRWNKEGQFLLACLCEQMYTHLCMHTHAQTQTGTPTLTQRCLAFISLRVWKEKKRKKKKHADCS